MIPVFFSGGTALRALSRELASQNLESVHIVSVFDSGGSSAAIRKAFAMPAVGDLRNRLLALANRRQIPPQVLDFCNMRLSKNDRDEASRQLARIADPANDFWKSVPQHLACAFLHNLRYFLERKPPSFDARNASVGNLLITGAYLEYNRNLAPALSLYGNLLHIKGTVTPIANANAHLGAVLENGAIIVGQHLFSSLDAKVEKLFLTVHEPGARKPDELDECRPPLLPDAAAWLGLASIICFPMGSFYSSILANLLPKGVGAAVARSPAIKLFIPNSGHDSENCGLGLAAQAAQILKYLRRDAPDSPTSRLIGHMLVDTQHGVYPGGCDSAVRRAIAEMGINLVDKPVVSRHNPCMHEPAATLEAIFQIASAQSHGNL